MAADLDLVRRIGAADSWLAIIAIARTNGRVHTSVVNAGVFDDPESGEPCVAFSPAATPASWRTWPPAGGPRWCSALAGSG